VLAVGPLGVRCYYSINFGVALDDEPFALLRSSRKEPFCRVGLNHKLFDVPLTKPALAGVIIVARRAW